MPNGWAKAIFEDLLDYIQPTKFIVESTEYDDRYKTPVLTAGKSFIIGRTDEKNGIFNEIPVIIFDDFTTATKFVKFPFKVKSSAMKILSPVSNLVNIKYVFWYMQTLRINADTHKRYWISNYSRLPIPLPPLPEQQRIVAKIEELFSSLDKGIESLITSQQQLKVYRQSVLKWAFEGKLTNKKVKDGELPEGWKWVKLNEVASDISDGDHQAPPKSEKGIPFITISNVNKLTSKIDFSDTFKVNIDYYKNLKANRKPQKGDVLYTVTGSFGIPILIDYGKEFCFQRHIGLVRPLNTVSQKWVYYVLQSPQIFNQAKETATGTAQKTVALSSLRNFNIPFCSFEEQQTIVAEIESRLSVCDKIEESIEQSLKQSESLRQSILKKAFEGKLVSQDPNDEPASVLLDRIKAAGKKNKPENPPHRQTEKTKTKKAKS